MEKTQEKANKEERKYPNAMEKVHKEERKYSDARGIVRIIATDIPGSTTIQCGLTKIKGVSWSISNAVCHILGIAETKKMHELTETDIEKITNFLKSPSIPSFLMNRRNDLGTGLNKHLIKTDLDLQKEFDVRNMKKIRSYKGWRHALGQPVRGQRTKSHFRKGRAMGVQKAKPQPATSPKTKAKAKEGKGK